MQLPYGYTSCFGAKNSHGGKSKILNKKVKDLNLKKINIAPTNVGCWAISSGGQRTVSNG